jgi:hypothetical protein
MTGFERFGVLALLCLDQARLGDCKVSLAFSVPFITSLEEVDPLSSNSLCNQMLRIALNRDVGYN